jgi:hypothetical protein
VLDTPAKRRDEASSNLEAGMCAILTFRNWVIFALLCVAIAAALAWTRWPTLPMDSGLDPATLAAYQAEVIAHWLRFGLIGLGVPLLVLIIGRLACGRRPERL